MYNYRYPCDDGLCLALEGDRDLVGAKCLEPGRMILGTGSWK